MSITRDEYVSECIKSKSYIYDAVVIVLESEHVIVNLL